MTARAKCPVCDTQVQLSDFDQRAAETGNLMERDTLCSDACERIYAASRGRAWRPSEVRSVEVEKIHRDGRDLQVHTFHGYVHARAALVEFFKCGLICGVETRTAEQIREGIYRLWVDPELNAAKAAPAQVVHSSPDLHQPLGAMRRQAQQLQANADLLTAGFAELVTQRDALRRKMLDVVAFLERELERCDKAEIARIASLRDMLGRLAVQ